MPSHLLDSNILILALRSQLSALDLMDDLRIQGRLCISVATRTEILAGMRPHEEARTMDLLTSLISLPVTISIADQAGRWINQYARRGIQLSFPDALIAATALAHGLTLATTNARHFPIEGLQILPFDTHG
ncbi:MAG: type II toxin-antitoxin system VapC family toxin [Chloroflexi bacterium]|nr:type II toxin-antitoxin system VapC family toxin [Chloroflexota bacterium]MBU1749007.1 type II toxin-antitoxin system VapC family toxin [Chloroflexota bacterium]MBU1877929.1 type II toxin-antitoxin system VapC family toxin [Chloroflexota bacterium]